MCPTWLNFWLTAFNSRGTCVLHAFDLFAPLSTECARTPATRCGLRCVRLRLSVKHLRRGQAGVAPFDGGKLCARTVADDMGCGHGAPRNPCNGARVRPKRRGAHERNPRCDGLRSLRLYL